MLLSAGPRARIAVIVNQKARAARPELIHQLGRLVTPRDLYLSGSMDESRDIATEVIARRYDGVLLGGGDGTFVQCLDDLSRAARLRGAALPAVGVLPLGTGNAIGWALGAERPTVNGLVKELRRARSGRFDRVLDLLEIDGKKTPFAGCGLDAQIQEDFGWMGRTIDRLAGGARNLAAGPRYALTVGLRSVPRFLLEERPEIVVINTGRPAYRIDWRTGQPREDAPVAAGEVLFRGRAALCTASTIPFWGLRMKMFPFVGLKEGMFQLRCSTASAYETLRNLPGVFRGEYRTPNLHDFLCDAIEVKIDRPVPVQIGGDLSGEPRRSFSVRRSAEPIRVVAAA
jgi:diacylglycerol kinase family enzyme